MGEESVVVEVMEEMDIFNWIDASFHGECMDACEANSR